MRLSEHPAPGVGWVVVVVLAAAVVVVVVVMSAAEIVSGIWS